MKPRLPSTYGVRYDPHEHRYFPRDDQEVPGVTRVLRQGGILDASYYTEDCSNRGTAVHRACELYGIGHRGGQHRHSWGSLNIDSVHPSVSPLVERYRALVERTSMTILGSEVLVADSSRRYATRIDAWVEHEGSTGPLSIKTGAGAPWHLVQLAAEMAATRRPRGWLVYLDHARPLLYHLRGRLYLERRRVFEHALALFWWRHAHGDVTCFGDRRATADFHEATYKAARGRSTVTSDGS